MYYNDINVTIQEAFEPSVGLINRAFLVTHEATCLYKASPDLLNAVHQVISAFRSHRCAANLL